MKITVRFFARFKEMVGTAQASTEITEGTTIIELVEALHTQFPNLELVPERTLFSVNQEFATSRKVLQNGDEVAIFPPVSGGIDDNKFSITTAPLSIEKVAQMVTHPHTGAVATFTGVVRNVSGGKAVSSLEYEAYQEMAVSKLKQVADEARRKWPDIVDIAISQRIGHLAVGDVAVIIAVSSGHRNQGCFEACRYGIDRLKEIVPVWKKEIGPDGEEWIEGDHNPSSNTGKQNS